MNETDWAVPERDHVHGCNEKVCGNCRFSRTTRIFDPVAASFDHLKQFSEGSVTKCHIQGAPRQVDPVVDWCYKWETKGQ